MVLPDVTRQRGASLVMAIFILVILSLLSAAMINLLTTGSESVAREVVSIRALFAAESGGQLRLNEVFIGGDSCQLCSAGATTSTYTVASCSASVDCCRYQPTDGNTYYQLRSTGRCGASPDQAIRIVELQARQ